VTNLKLSVICCDSKGKLHFMHALRPMKFNFATDCRFISVCGA
jgi:hypothetical protein